MDVGSGGDWGRVRGVGGGGGFLRKIREKGKGEGGGG